MNKKRKDAEPKKAAEQSSEQAPVSLNGNILNIDIISYLIFNIHKKNNHVCVLGCIVPHRFCLNFSDLAEILVNHHLQGGPNVGPDQLYMELWGPYKYG